MRPRPRRIWQGRSRVRTEIRQRCRRRFAHGVRFLTGCPHGVRFGTVFARWFGIFDTLIAASGPHERRSRRGSVRRRADGRRHLGGAGANVEAPADKSENAQSVGSVVTFGSFKVAHLGDLTWSKRRLHRHQPAQRLQQELRTRGSTGFNGGASVVLDGVRFSHKGSDGVRFDRIPNRARAEPRDEPNLVNEPCGEPNTVVEPTSNLRPTRTSSGSTSSPCA
jgi:hypothetical protein